MDKNLNKELNEEIKSLFYWMIRSWDRITKIEGGYIYFDNGLSLTAFEKDSNEKIEENSSISIDDWIHSFHLIPTTWRINFPDTNKLIFRIQTPYRQYVVPEITNRMEYAETLDILENGLRKFEKKMLSQYLKHFSEASSQATLS